MFLNLYSEVTLKYKYFIFKFRQILFNFLRIKLCIQTGKIIYKKSPYTKQTINYIIPHFLLNFACDFISLKFLFLVLFVFKVFLSLS